MNRKIKINCMLCKQNFMIEDGIEGNPPKVTGIGVFTADYIRSIDEKGNVENTIDKLKVEPFIMCPTCEAIINDVIESRDPQFRNRQIQQSMQDYAEEYHRVKMDEEIGAERDPIIMAGSKPLSFIDDPDSLEKNGIDPDYLEEDE